MAYMIKDETLAIGHAKIVTAPTLDDLREALNYLHATKVNLQVGWWGFDDESICVRGDKSRGFALFFQPSED